METKIDYNPIDQQEEEHAIETYKYENKKSRQSFKRKWLFIFIAWLLLFGCTEFIHVWYHEDSHRAIYDSYNISYTSGIDASKWYTGIITFYVQADDQDFNKKCDTTCNALELEVEVFGYNLSGIFYSIWMISFLYLIKSLMTDSPD